MKKLLSYCVKETNTIKDAVAIIQSNYSRCVIVLNNHDKVVGVFSEGDVLQSILNDIEIHTPLSRVVKPSFHYLNEKDIKKAYEYIKKYGITLVPIIDNNFKLKDVITTFDVMDHLKFEK